MPAIQRSAQARSPSGCTLRSSKSRRTRAQQEASSNYPEQLCRLRAARRIDPHLHRVCSLALPQPAPRAVTPLAQHVDRPARLVAIHHRGRLLPRRDLRLEQPQQAPVRLPARPAPPAVRKSPSAAPPPPAAAGSRALPLGACGRSPERADRFESTPCQADRRPFRRSEMADLACGRASRRVPDSSYRRRPRDRRLLPQAPRYSPPHRDAARRPVEQPQHPPPVRAQLDLAVVARFGPARFVLPPAARAAARSLLALPLLPFFPNPCSSARLVRWGVVPTLLSPPRQSNSPAACILFDGNPRVHRFGDDFISSLLQLRSGQPRCPSALAPCRWASAIRLLGFVYPAPARNGPACRKNLHNRQRL